MFRWMAMVFGLALGVLWLVGVRGAIAPDWLSWADLVGAVAAFLAAGSLRTMSSRSLRASISFVFSAGLFAVWFIAISTDVPPMLAWWHFALAMGFLFLGMGTFPAYHGGRNYVSDGAFGQWFGEYYWPPVGPSTFGLHSWPFRQFGQPHQHQNHLARRGSVKHRGVAPKNYERSDQRILEDINDRLMLDGDVDPSDLEVTVSKGEVVLQGTVESRAAKRWAEEIADSVPGVRDVYNRITIRHRVQPQRNARAVS